MSINAFYVEDMTSIRYAFPFIKTAKKLLNEDILLIYNDDVNRHKYNSIAGHKQKFEKLCKDHEVLSISHVAFKATQEKIQNLFCIENVAKSVDYKKCYSFQHGFDYRFLHKNKAATYLVTEKYFEETLKSEGTIALVQPYPVTFWDWDFHIKFAEKYENFSKKSAILFFPEQNGHELFKSIYQHLENDYTIRIKQRSKSQSVPSEYKNVFYDEDWYPSESIILPMISDISIGFGTSAYTDIVHLDRIFIDFAVPDYSKIYYKPKRDNFISIDEDFFENFCKLNLKQVTVEEKLNNPCDYEEIKKFLEQILS